ncbi:unnamed protein product [Camellia sinensis]
MPCSSSVNSTEDNGALCNFKLNESTFLASLMPKKEIKADRFIEAHPDFDGRGVVIAIFAQAVLASNHKDSGVDPAAAGLQVTSDGKPKILDVIDCGDIDTSNVVKADADGCLCGASGASLVVNSSWKNPSGEWHVGCKLVYELFTDTLTSRLKKERKKKWDEKHQEAIAEAIKCLDEFDKKHVKVEDANLKRAREDLQNKVDFLRKQADAMKGPVIDAVVWHDGELWRVALDTVLRMILSGGNLLNLFDEDKGKGCSTACTKSVFECLEEEVRDAKIKVLASLKQGTAEECLEWKKLSSSLKVRMPSICLFQSLMLHVSSVGWQSEYPKYTPLLAKILEGLLSQNNVEDKIPHLEEIIDAADEVIDSVDTDELAKYFSFKSDPEDEGAEKVKKKMETARDQLAEALYQKGLAMAEIGSLKRNGGFMALSLSLGAIGPLNEWKDVTDLKTDGNQSKTWSPYYLGQWLVVTGLDAQCRDTFDRQLKQVRLKMFIVLVLLLFCHTRGVDEMLCSSKYATLLVICERRCGRLGTALKGREALNDMIQVDGEAPKKKLYELKLSLLDQIGWGHLVSYKRQWMHVRFPVSLPLF